MLKKIIIAFLLSGNLSWAGEFALNNNPTDVELFLQGAIVHRVTKLDLPVGSHILLAKGIPSEIVPNSLRVEGEGDFSIGTIDTIIINADKAVYPPEEAAIAKFREVEDRLEILKAEKNALEMRQSFITAMAEGGGDVLSESIAKGNFNPEQMRKVWETIEIGHAETARAIIAKAPSLRKLEDEYGKAQADLEAVSKGRKDSLDIKIAIEVKKPGPVMVDLSYRVNDANWRPSHNLRLDSEKRQVGLIQQGIISQRTGEDWTKLRLVLSTSQTKGRTSVPDTNSWWVNLQPKDQPRPQLRDAMPMAMPMAAPPPPKAKSAAAAAAAVNSVVEVVDSEFNAEFQIPGAFSLGSGPEEKRVTLSETKLDAKMEIRAAIAFDNVAYVHALVKYQGNAPLLPGGAALFRDGTFVGESHLATVQVGEEISLAFGRDDKWRIKRLPVVDEKSKVGTFIADAVLKRLWRVEVENLHAKSMRISLIDRLPVADDERLKIEPIAAALTPDRKELDGKVGVIAWDVEVPARKSHKFETGFEARWPTDMRPSGF